MKRKRISRRRNVCSAPTKRRRLSENEGKPLNSEPVLEFVGPQRQETTESDVSSDADGPIPRKRVRFLEAETAALDLQQSAEKGAYACSGIANCSLCQKPFELITWAHLPDKSRPTEKLSGSSTNERRNSEEFRYYLIPRKQRLQLHDTEPGFPLAAERGSVPSDGDTFSQKDENLNESLPLDMDCCYSCLNARKILHDLITICDIDNDNHVEQQYVVQSMFPINDPLNDDGKARNSSSDTDEEESHDCYRNQGVFLKKLDTGASNVNQTPNTANQENSRFLQESDSFRRSESTSRETNTQPAQNPTEKNTFSGEANHPHYDANVNFRSTALETKISETANAEKLSPRSLFSSPNVYWQLPDLKDTEMEKSQIPKNFSFKRQSGRSSSRSDEVRNACYRLSSAKPESLPMKASKQYEAEILDFVGRILNTETVSRGDVFSASAFLQLISDFLEAVKEYDFSTSANSVEFRRIRRPGDGCNIESDDDDDAQRNAEREN